MAAVDLLDPDARAADARLDEHRQGEPLEALEAGGRVSLELIAADRFEIDHGHAGGEHLPLEEELVHGERAGGDARSHIRKVEHLAEALQGPVLAPRAVDDREQRLDARLDQVPQGRSDRLPHRRDDLETLGKDLLGLRGVDPAAILGDAQRSDLVTGLPQTLGDRAGRADRDLMLDAPPSEDDADVRHGCSPLTLTAGSDGARFPTLSDAEGVPPSEGPSPISASDPPAAPTAPIRARSADPPARPAAPDPPAAWPAPRALRSRRRGRSAPGGCPRC